MLATIAITPSIPASTFDDDGLHILVPVQQLATIL
jgi:hypothetical protein